MKLSQYEENRNLPDSYLPSSYMVKDKKNKGKAPIEEKGLRQVVMELQAQVNRLEKMVRKIQRVEVGGFMAYTSVKDYNLDESYSGGSYKKGRKK